MKRIAVYLLTLFLAVLPHLSAAQQKIESCPRSQTPAVTVDLTEEEICWLGTHTVLKVGIEVDWPPFQYAENGEEKGHSIDLLRLAGQKVGLAIESISGPTWSQLMAMLSNGEIDILPAIVKTKERAKFIAFTSAYMSGPVVIVSQQNDRSVRNIGDLNGKRLAMVNDYYYEESLRRSYPDINLLPVTGMLEGLKAVLSGSADAFIGNRTVIDALVRRHLISGLQIVGQTGIENIDRFSLHMGVAKQQTILASIIDKAILAINDEEKQALYDRWIGIGISMHSQTQSAHLTEDEKSFIRAHPIIRASNELNWAPFNFVDNGQAAGFSVEYLKLVAAKMDIKLEFVSGKWDELLHKSFNRELDVMLNIIKTEPRTEYLNFTKPYANSPMAIFSRSEDQPLKNLDDLLGKRVAVIDSFYTHQYLEQHYPLIELIPLSSSLAGLKAVSSGEVDAVLNRLAVGNYLIAYNFIHNVLPTGTTGIDELDKAGWRFGVRKDWPELAAILEKGMNLVSGEEFSTLVRKWYLYGAPIVQPVVNLNKEEKAWLKAHPVIRVSSEADYYPFDFRIDEQPSGYSIDYVELLAERLGIRLEYVHDTWDNLQKKAENRELDLVHSIFNTPKERENYLSFSKPYKTVFTAIIVKNETDDIAGVEDLAARKVAIIKGDSLVESLKIAQPEAQHILFDSYGEALRAVAFGLADAHITELPAASYYMRKLSLTNLKIAAEAPSLGNRDQQYRLAVRKDWQPLIPILEKAMDTLTADELKLLDDRWLSPPEASKVKALLLSAQEKAWLAKHPKLSLAYDTEWPPIEFTDSKGQYAGITADFFVHMQKLLAIEIKPLSPRSWTEMLNASKQGKADIISALSHTEERGEFLNFTSPYLKIPIVIVTRKEESFIVDIKELKNKRVAVVKNHYSHDILKSKHPDIEPFLVNDTQEGLLAVNQQRAFAFVGGLAVVGHVIGHSGLSEGQVSGETPYQYALAMGTRKDEPILAGIMQKALDAIPQEERNAIFRKWFRVTYEHKVDYTLIWQLLFIAMLIFLAFLFWNRKLSGLNQQLVIAKEAEKNSRMSAESANRAKSIFLANMSHEIRTPMNAILGFSEILQKDAATTDEQQEALSIINNAGNHLLALINDILDISKIEARRMTLVKADVDLKSMLNDMEKMFRVRTHEKGLELVFDGIQHLPDAISIDAGKLRQILINLLGNAVKFTNTGRITCLCVVEIVADCSFKISIAVSDTGPGIDQKEKDKVFSIFEQTTSGLTTQGGTGLGLAISREYARLMGGDITFTSRVGEGTTFSFYMLAKKGKVSGPLNPEQEIIGLAEGQPQYRILVVDDVEPNRKLVNAILSPLGFTVVEVVNGKDAVDSFENIQADLILMDFRMPIMNGVEATKLIKETEKGKNTPIIAMTASVLENQKHDILEYGADDFLPKPFQQHQLLEMIKKHLGIEYRYGERTGPDKSPIKSDIKSQKDRIENISHKKFCVLIVDDNIVNRTIANKILSKQGYHCEEASNGQEAIKAIETQQPDVMLLDMQMPVMNGYEVLASLKTLPLKKELPVIASTAENSADEEEKILNLGAVAICEKPLSSKHLIETVKRLTQ